MTTCERFPASAGASKHTIVFDHLVAPTAYYITRAEFEEWWVAAQTTDTQISWHNSNSWRGFARKS
ncbi:MAG: hypothetical protein WKF84_14480 [Pyrinomonadaceae bacterium]